MSRIRIVTDSTSDIPRSVREQWGIAMVPLKVHIGTETFLDAVTLESSDFYNRLARSSSLPTTSQPSPVEFLDTYKRLLKEDPETEIISIHLSSAMSGTFQSAQLARSLLDTPERLTVVDSKSASYGLGLLAVKAAEAAREGLGLPDVLERIAKLREETRIYFLVGTLEYLQKGGRIAKAQAMLGTLLNIKPILTVDAEGEVAPTDRVRGQRKAMQRIVELLQRDFGEEEIDLMAAHCNAPDAAEELGALVKEKLRVRRTDTTDIGPVIGTHVGPGTSAVFAWPAR